ncbi:MAG: enoyl-CoA hydratase/isomerase family protein [SAR202 cluster bacterium]|jgi:enoyl-CoA hydratase/carnithine racemase|nr:enoyl-CoA hydratase/isomerase family protein [SAR202 cluster bacterium]MDP6300484.1 enoyl-CoA hydratase/isomerase family protein [SAR202 cluster bacterium]MDP7224116.1 enoyl-CoA hydratase/isomerase family protein [SAR202 cluster bacterium]MDP7412314.1 enoyl-CoA hydratase/isomerase family protein [SAR202 cluster bacterium]MDP7532484.1 enoyl-CoA hydratase/isomerase family protein [SAR202 cluster bacterium]|tara:strand:- start:1468 stop:2235 length:768 start_codon:yes stop_codon:yes gene_type:complete
MSTVEYEVRNRVGYITLNRPDKLNAIDVAMRDELWVAIHDVNENPDIWLAVITGNGRAFSVGHDLVAMSGRGDDLYSDEISTEDLYVYQTQVFKPIIASINGLCLAQGGGIALASDIRIASDQAQFGWPQAKRGIGSVSGPCMLAHRVPLNYAFEFLFTGDFINAERALELGMVNKVVPHDELESATDEVVQKLLNNAPLAMRAIKEVAVRGLSMRLEDRVRLAGIVNRRLQRTEDAQEGLAAFAEKRTPVFRGK